MPYSG